MAKQYLYGDLLGFACHRSLGAARVSDLLLRPTRLEIKAGGKSAMIRSLHATFAINLESAFTVFASFCHTNETRPLY